MPKKRDFSLRQRRIKTLISLGKGRSLSPRSKEKIIKSADRTGKVDAAGNSELCFLTHHFILMVDGGTASDEVLDNLEVSFRSGALESGMSGLKYRRE